MMLLYVGYLSMIIIEKDHKLQLEAFQRVMEWDRKQPVEVQLKPKLILIGSVRGNAGTILSIITVNVHLCVSSLVCIQNRGYGSITGLT
jgi:hypothetical protein